MRVLESFVAGAWRAGTGEGQLLVNPTTEEPMARAACEGLGLEEALQYARREGGGALAALSFAERGAMLGAMSRRIHEHRDELIELAMENGGNTRSDAKFDIDGAIGTLSFYAELGASLGAHRILADGEAVPLTRSPRLVGRHVWVPRTGVALHINAFNFPAWGFAEKAAAALLAGMPLVTKPATSTALVAHRIVELVADAAPKGAISLVCGSAHELPGLLGPGDVIAFTGSSDTARKLRGLEGVLSADVRLNVEADSLNSAVLGPDVEPGSDTYELFLSDVVREIRQKTGQKCTAVRRIFVSSAQHERVRDDLADRLGRVVVGDPTSEGVHMGPLATAQQRRDVLAGLTRLAAQARIVVGGLERPSHIKAGPGYFVAATLLEAEAVGADVVHDLEVFGPIATLVRAPEDAAGVAALVARGKGGLVCSAYTDDRAFAGALLRGVAPHHGRLVFGSQKIAGQAIGPGTVMPHLIHGGPGRAGGGEELGGLRGLALYSQRTALQGDRALLDAIVG